MSKKEKYRISKEEKEFIKYREFSVKAITAYINQLPRFQVDDIILIQEKDYDEDGNIKYNTLKNSYSLPIKHKVICVDANGVSYFKKLNKDGKPSGELLSNLDFNIIEDVIEGRFDLDDDYDLYTQVAENGFTDFSPLLYKNFILDPDYEDSILLDQKDFDPMAVHKHKNELHKKVMEYNKSIRISIDPDGLEKLSKLKVGDPVWTKNSQKPKTITKITLTKNIENIFKKSIKLDLADAPQTIERLFFKEFLTLSNDKHLNILNIEYDYPIYISKPKKLKEEL